MKIWVCVCWIVLALMYACRYISVTWLKYYQYEEKQQTNNHFFVWFYSSFTKRKQKELYFWVIEIQQFLVDLLHCNKQEVTYCNESTMWRKDCTGLTLFAKKICNKMNWNILGGWFYKTKHAKTCFFKKRKKHLHMICTNNRCRQTSISTKIFVYISPSAMQRCYNAENTWKIVWLVGWLVGWLVDWL